MVEVKATSCWVSMNSRCMISAEQKRSCVTRHLRLLPGITYANLARVEATMSRQSSLNPVLRKNYVREAREWAERAKHVLEPMAKDLTEGRRAQRVLADVNALSPVLETGSTT